MDDYRGPQPRVQPNQRSRNTHQKNPMNKLQTALLQTFIEDVPRNLARFDEATGRFLTEGGWAITNQDHIYPLALLYTTAHADNPYYHDATLLPYIQRGGDAWRDFQYPDGKVEFIKVDDSTWGPIYMPWSMYHWVETYALVADELGEERRARWQAGLTLAYDGIAAQLANGRVHNIPTWDGMATYRAGQLFDRADWRAAGEAMIHLAVKEQMPGGYWLEHHGPTPSYNTVYVHAIGLYYYFSGDDSVLPALERATDFHIRYTYPDGRLVETIDGRVKYHDRVNVHGWSAFSLFPQGRRYVNFLFDHWLADRRAHPLPHLTYNQTTGGPKIASGEYGLSARLAPLLQHYDGPNGQTDEESIPQEQPVYRIHDPEHAILHRKDGWFVCLSGVVTPVVESRWGQDRQSYLSIWHEETGLLVGGGNAKDQPQLSTFAVGAGETLRYIPTTAHLATEADKDQVTLGYDTTTCTVEVSIENAQQILITFSGPAESTSALGQLPLKVNPGTPLQSATGASYPTEQTKLDLDADTVGGWLQHGRWRIHMPPESRLLWPVAPFNPYAADGAGPLEEAAAVLVAPLGAAPVTVTLEIVAA